MFLLGSDGGPVNVLVLRGSWTTNCRTKTTLCLFLPFTAARELLHFFPPLLILCTPHFLHPTSQQNLSPLDAADPSACLVTTRVIDGLQEWSGNSEMVTTRGKSPPLKKDPEDCEMGVLEIFLS